MSAQSGVIALKRARWTGHQSRAGYCACDHPRQPSLPVDDLRLVGFYQRGACWVARANLPLRSPDIPKGRKSAVPARLKSLNRPTAKLVFARAGKILNRFDRRKGLQSFAPAVPETIICCAHSGTCVWWRKRRWPDEPAIASLHPSSRDVTVSALRACRRFL